MEHKGGPLNWELDNSTTLSLKMTSRSWRWFLAWLVKLVKDTKQTKIGVGLARPMEVAKQIKTRVGSIKDIKQIKTWVNQ